MGSPLSPLTRRHLRAGWLALVVAALLGLGLEAFVGLRLPFYTDLAVENRRDLWRLAHAHLALLGVVHLAFAFSARETKAFAAAKLTGALLFFAFLMPIGFYLGGAFLSGSEPGWPVLLAPLGGLAFGGGLVGAARASWA